MWSTGSGFSFVAFRKIAPFFQGKNGKLFLMTVIIILYDTVTTKNNILGSPCRNTPERYVINETWVDATSFPMLAVNMYQWIVTFGVSTSHTLNPVPQTGPVWHFSSKVNMCACVCVFVFAYMFVFTQNQALLDNYELFMEIWQKNTLSRPTKDFF